MHITENSFDLKGGDEGWFECLACVPELMQRCKAAMNLHAGFSVHLEDLRLETISLRDDCRAAIITLRDRLENYKMDIRPTELAAQIHAHYLRSLGLGLATGVVLNCLSSRLEGDVTGKCEESSRWSTEIMQLAEMAVKYQPLGSMAMILCLHMAWVGATDAGTKQKIKALLADYDKACMHRAAGDVDAELEKTRKRFALEEIPERCGPNSLSREEMVKLLTER